VANREDRVDGVVGGRPLSPEPATYIPMVEYMSPPVAPVSAEEGFPMVGVEK
jgi:hypothetical protein